MAALLSHRRKVGFDEPRFSALACELVLGVHVGALDADAVVSLLREITTRLRVVTARADRVLLAAATAAPPASQRDARRREVNGEPSSFQGGRMSRLEIHEVP